MRILNRKQFLAIGKEVVFSLYDPCCFDGIYIKTDNNHKMENDFYAMDLIGAVDSNNDSEYLDQCEKALREDVQIDLYCSCRDGGFEDDQLFAVYSTDDVRQLIQRLKEVINDR